MPKSIYLINPIENSPTYHGTDVYKRFGFEPAASIADLTTTTVAAMVPDDFEVVVCDEHISPADLDCSADVVGITGKSTQVERMITLAKAYRQRGKIIMMGGPYVSLSPDRLRPHCDILVRGEMEDIAEKLFADLREGCWQPEYAGNRPDITRSPIPRWDLYPNHRAMMGCVQTSRGCPFECEFCDVIQYLGRKQRHKSVDQVLAELDVLYKLGYRGVFLADDNFTVFRRRSKELLRALRDWNNHQTEGRIFFSTQLSIDTAQEEEILQLLSEAGPFEVFIGLETPNEESLRETKKRQNLGINLVDQIQRFFDHGISVTGGMIVGFDADEPDIFERQYQFAMSTSIPMFTLGALVAPAATPLYERLKSARRLVSENEVDSLSEPWSTNIIPLRMTQEQLFTGLRWLASHLYQPDAFCERMLGFIDKCKAQPLGQQNPSSTSRRLTSVHVDFYRVVRNITRLGPAEAKMLSNIMAALAKKPSIGVQVMPILFRYMQFRYVYEYGQLWEPHYVEEHSPNMASADY